MNANGDFGGKDTVVGDICCFSLLRSSLKLLADRVERSEELLGANCPGF
jgi:hypothetical protein